MPSRLRTVARSFGAVCRVVIAMMYFAGAVVVLWPGVLDLNVALRGGMAAFFAGRGVSSTMLGVAQRRTAESAVILRSYRFLSYSYVASGILVGMGAFWYGGIAGFLGAYAAFSFAWVGFWVRRKLSEAERRSD